MNRKRIARTAIAALSFLLLMPTLAADKAGRYVILGFGTSSCGKFVKDRKTSSDSHYKAWLTGSLSSLNATSSDTYNIMGSTDLEGAMLWIENYCKSNPLDSFEIATTELVNKLRPNRRRSADPSAQVGVRKPSERSDRTLQEAPVAPQARLRNGKSEKGDWCEDEKHCAAGLACSVNFCEDLKRGPQ